MQLKDFLLSELDKLGNDIDKTTQFFKNYSPRQDEELVYSEVAIQKLSQLSDQDGYTLISGLLSWLSLYASSDKLGEIKKMRTQLPPRPGLRDYRIDCDEIIQKLENRKSGICDCASKILYNTPPWDDLFETKSSEINSAQYTETYWVVCKSCGKEHSCEKRDDYHYPIFEWKY